MILVDDSLDVFDAARLMRALELVRAALDSPANMGDEDIERLHEAEGLLADELGNPPWLGRP